MNHVLVDLESPKELTNQLSETTSEETARMESVTFPLGPTETFGPVHMQSDEQSDPPSLFAPAKAQRYSKRVRRDGLSCLDGATSKQKKKNLDIGMSSNSFLVLQNTDDSILEELPNNFGVSLGHDKVVAQNISLIKAKELAQEALQKAAGKRKQQSDLGVENSIQ